MLAASGRGLVKASPQPRQRTTRNLAPRPEGASGPSITGSRSLPPHWRQSTLSQATGRPDPPPSSCNRRDSDSGFTGSTLAERRPSVKDCIVGGGGSTLPPHRPRHAASPHPGG